MVENRVKNLFVLLTGCLDDETFLSLTLSDPQNVNSGNRGTEISGAKIKGAALMNDEQLRRVIVRPVMVRGQQKFQFARQIGRQEFHENLLPHETVDAAMELLKTVFQNGVLRTSTATHRLLIRRNGRCRIKTELLETTKKNEPLEGSRSSANSDSQQQNSQQQNHNRSKQYLIPEGTPCPFLAEIGVMTLQGKVHAAKSRKFRQINRFLELVNHALGSFSEQLGDEKSRQIPNSQRKTQPKTKPFTVIDFGCGKSSLTFALHHLLRTIHGYDAQLTGLDHDSKVIRRCQEIAQRLQCDGLTFQTGTIADYVIDQPVEKSSVDLVVSLHACDTATDDALAKAVQWNTQVILAVPCCQHELFAKIQNEQCSTLTRHGILKERFAALATDALRAEILEFCGYRTQVVEFIDMEHTAKNVLIRAIRIPQRRAISPARIAAYHALKSQLGLEKTALEERLHAELPAEFNEKI